MALIPLTEEEALQVQPRAVRLGPIATLVPVDPLDDFEVFNALEDEKEVRGFDPEDPGVASRLWEGVKGVVKALPKAGWALAKIAGTAGPTPYNPTARVPTQAEVDQARALTTQAAGEVLSGYSTLGQGAKTVVQKGIFGATGLIDPERAAEMKKLSRRAAWEFAREAREAEQFTGEFNRHLETLFPRALAGLSAVPVDRAEAQAFSMLADPANLVPAGAAARLSFRVPLRGAVRSAEAAVKEATLELAEAQAKREGATLLLKPGLSAAERGPLFAEFRAADAAAKAAAARKEQALKSFTRVASEQRTIVDQMANEAASMPLATRAAAAGARGVGGALESAGAGLQRAAALPDALAKTIAGGADAEAARGIADGVRNVSSLAGILPATVGPAGIALSRSGRSLQTFGRLLAEAEGQLSFFRRLARETQGLTSWGASLVDQSGLGDVVVPASQIMANATRGLPIAGLVGFAQSGGDVGGAAEAVGGGAVFGLAGGAYGQWRRYRDPATFRQKQAADVARFKSTLPTDEVRGFYEKLPGPEQAALATIQLAHPDLKVQYSKLGKEKPSFYYVAEDGPVAVVNLDTKDAISGVLAHEVGHHVERHGLGPVIERVMFGDPLTNKPGLFTAFDAEGKPMVDATGAFSKTPEWEALKQSYNSRIAELARRTGERIPARDDAAIAREVFAEQVADYLTGAQSTFSKDLQSNVWTRAVRGLADSSLVASAPALRTMLGKLGVPLAGNEKAVMGSGLFPNGAPASPQLRRLISEYHQKSSRNRMPALEDEPGNTRYTADELAKYPQIAEKLFDGSDDLARTASGKVKREKNGAPIFQTPKEQKAQRAALAEALTQAIEAKKGEVPARYEQTKEGGKTVEGWVTPFIPDDVLDSLKASGKFNPTQIENLRAASQAIREGRGKSLLFFYQPATRAGSSGKYRSLAGDWRTETPYAIFISKAGNVLLRTMSREKLMANAQDLIAKGRGKLWNDSLPALVADIDTYLANHAAGKPGADGIGTEKRDAINALFGINTAVNQRSNPLLETSPKAPVVIRSRRLDRANRLTPVEEYFPTNYQLLNSNFRPETPTSSESRSASSAR